MRKSLLIGGGAIAVIAIVITAIVLSGVIEQEEDLVLSNYPKLFEKEVVIVIGENATQMEYESAEAIAANLENLTGNKPKIYISEKTESLKYTYNLIILGTPNSNKVLKEVCKMTNVTRVTDEYPGEGEGILEILRNPWNGDKAMLLVEGSDEWGVKAGSEMLTSSQKLVGKNIEVPSKVRVIQGEIKQMSMRPLMGMWVIQTSDGDMYILTGTKAQEITNLGEGTKVEVKGYMTEKEIVMWTAGELSKGSQKAVEVISYKGGGE